LAFEDYNQAIHLKPDYADAYYNWGYAYDKLGQYQPAIEYYNQAIRLNPNYARAYINRGVAYLLRATKNLAARMRKSMCIGKLQIVRNGQRQGRLPLI